MHMKVLFSFILTACAWALCCSASSALEVGDTAKNFALRDTNGRIVTLAGLMKGARATVLDILSVHCASCREKVPHVIRVYERFADRGVAVVSIALGNSQPETDAFAEETHMPFQLLADPDKITYYLYKVDKVPRFFIIDGSGIIRHRGPLTNPAAFEEKIIALLNEPDGLLHTGDRAPQITLPDPDGTVVSIRFSRSDFSTIIGFFNADDKRNRAQAALLKRIHQKNSINGLRLFGIAADSFAGHAGDFAVNQSLPFPLLIDKDGDLFKTYCIGSEPEIITVNPAGRIKGRETPKTYSNLLEFTGISEDDSSEAMTGRSVIQVLKELMPDTTSIEPFSLKGETIYKGTDRLGHKQYARPAKRNILCDVCSDVHFIYTLNQEGIYQDIKLLRPFEFYGTPIEADGFLNQFLGKSYHRKFIADVNVDVISGATKSCLELIKTLNETEQLFSGYTDDRLFDASFRKKVCYMHQAEIEWAVKLYKREHAGDNPSEASLEHAASYCPGGRIPACPAGGTYRLFHFNNIPRVMCTIHGLDPQSSTYSLR